MPAIDVFLAKIVNVADLCPNLIGNVYEENILFLSDFDCYDLPGRFDDHLDAREDNLHDECEFRILGFKVAGKFIIYPHTRIMCGYVAENLNLTQDQRYSHGALDNILQHRSRVENIIDRTLGFVRKQNSVKDNLVIPLEVYIESTD